MKAILNLGLRTVVLVYTIKERDESIELVNNDTINYYGRNMKCTQAVQFTDTDEWVAVTLYDGRVVDVHFDYELCSMFVTKKDWLSYIIQAYPVMDSTINYDNQLITSIKLEL